MSAPNGVRGDPAQRAPSATAGQPMRWRVLAVSQFATFTALLDVSIVNVALPSIERGSLCRPAPSSGSCPAMR